MTSAASGGTRGAWIVSGAGSPARCAATSCCALARPAKGWHPASSSYATTPQAWRSARWSTPSPAACSGAMDAGVPSEVPTCVSVPAMVPLAAVDGSAREAASAFAMPESVAAAAPPVSSTFSGLMSRCTTPCASAWAMARAASRSTAAASRIGNGPAVIRPRNSARRSALPPAPGRAPPPPLGGRARCPRRRTRATCRRPRARGRACRRRRARPGFGRAGDRPCWRG